MNEAEYLMKNYGDRGGCYPSRPQAEADNTRPDLHNSSYDTKAQNNSQFKNMAKICVLHRSIEVKFIFDSARLGLFSSANNILQIADVALRVVFLLFLPCLQLLFRPVLTLEMSEMSAIFVFTTKATQRRPQVVSINGALTCKEAALLTSSVH